MMCPCGSEREFEKCCGQYLSGALLPETSEALMRSRSTAFVRGDLTYIRQTLSPEAQRDFDAEAAKSSSQESVWLGLKIQNTTKGTSADKTGTVEFTAKYK